MSKEDKSRVRRRDDQLPSAPRGAQPGPASHQASAPHLLPRNDAIALAQWSAAIIAAAAALWLSRGTSWGQLAIGVLASLICACIGLSVVEIASRFVVVARFRHKRDGAFAESSNDRFHEDR